MVVVDFFPLDPFDACSLAAAPCAMWAQLHLGKKFSANGKHISFLQKLFANTTFWLHSTKMGSISAIFHLSRSKNQKGRTFASAINLTPQPHLGPRHSHPHQQPPSRHPSFHLPLLQRLELPLKKKLLACYNEIWCLAGILISLGHFFHIRGNYRTCYAQPTYGKAYLMDRLSSCFLFS